VRVELARLAQGNFCQPHTGDKARDREHQKADRPRLPAEARDEVVRLPGKLNRENEAPTQAGDNKRPLAKRRTAFGGEFADAHAVEFVGAKAFLLAAFKIPVVSQDGAFEHELDVAVRAAKRRPGGVVDLDVFLAAGAEDRLLVDVGVGLLHTYNVSTGLATRLLGRFARFPMRV